LKFDHQTDAQDLQSKFFCVRLGALDGGAPTMCHIFASQDPSNYAYETRSVRLMGVATSVRLEAKFWSVIEDIALMQRLTMPQFLNMLYMEALDIRGEVPNFASLLRCCCLNYLSPDFDRGKLLKQAKQDLAA
jgi:predicted DNA-binding ribbon-helix-helix protein